MISIVLADDHHLIRKSLRMMIEAEPIFRVIGEAEDGREAIALVERLKPNLLLLDLAIPKVHGLDVIREVTKSTSTRVLVLSMHSTESYVAEALNNGASGYLIKDAMPAHLISAIRQVAEGGTFLSATLRAETVGGRRPGHETDLLDSLTRREKIVLQLAAEGHNNTAIARKLGLSARTVESHRASLMRKLQLRSQTDIVCFAVRKNIISV